MNLQGKFLVATSKITDPIFSGKTVFILKHDKNCAEGVILNSEVVGKIGYSKTGSDILTKEQMKNMVLENKVESADLYYGGPCGESVCMIHDYEEVLSEDPEYIKFNKDKDIVVPGIYFGMPELMCWLVETDKVDKKRIKFFRGVSGWFKGQLEKEIEDGAWKVKNLNKELIFGNNLVHKPFYESRFLQFLEPSLN